jgi:histidine triad (HIT) family protein
MPRLPFGSDPRYIRLLFKNMSLVQKSDCLFCKIIAGSIPSPRVYEDDKFICIRDIRPQAKVHLLVIPKEHVASLDTTYPLDGASHGDLVGELFETGVKIAREQKLLPAGFRSVINTNEGGGQTVFHLHLHLLGGEVLGEEL